MQAYALPQSISCKYTCYAFGVTLSYSGAFSEPFSHGKGLSAGGGTAAGFLAACFWSWLLKSPFMNGSPCDTCCFMTSSVSCLPALRQQGAHMSSSNTGHCTGADCEPYGDVTHAYAHSAQTYKAQASRRTQWSLKGGAALPCLTMSISGC